MRARVAPLLGGVLACIGGCAQVLGLGDYGEAPEGGPEDATASVDVAADGSVADRALDRAPTDADALPPASNDGGTDDPDASGAQASDASTDDAVDAPTFDAPMDATVDAPSTDATADAGVDVCPTICNGGCGDGGTCTITITSITTGPVSCPPGFACHAVCSGTQVCPQPINCAAGQPCSVSCSGDEACTGGFINRGGATSLCVECLASGNPGCNAVTCTGMCTIHCVGGCGGSCGNCTPVSACP